MRGTPSYVTTNNSQSSAQPASHQPIGVFDSGLGGISVLREIHRQLPAESLLYVADSAHAPYGEKSPEYILERSRAISSFLLQQRAKALVVACNTATAHAVDQLRTELDVPLIGIEPAVKPAVATTRSGVVGVLATAQTVGSSRFQKLIDTHAASTHVIAQACPGLVEHVEQGDFSSDTVRQLLRHYVDPLLAQGADTLVLGCTHYPFLRDTLHELVGDDVTILETSQPVTQQLQRILRERNLLRVVQIDGDSKLGDILGDVPPDIPCGVQFFSSRTAADEQHTQRMAALWQAPVVLRYF